MRIAGHILIAAALAAPCTAFAADEIQSADNSPAVVSTDGDAIFIKVKGDELPHPLLGANSIVKWCEKDGEGVRYASSNIDLKGYVKCGELQASKTCDAVGNRFFSPQSDKKSPHGYLDCNIGPRIQIERHIDLEKEVIEFQDFREGSDGTHIKNEVTEEQKREHGSPYAIFDQLLNGNRNVDLFNGQQRKIERKRSSRRRNKSSRNANPGYPMPVGIPGGGFVDQLGPLLQGFGIDPAVLNPPRNKQDMRRQEDAVRKLFKQLSPEEKQMLEQMLGTSDIDSLLKGRR
ncbi:MAG: hypothetical protein KDD66_14850 [Bdellovibrionales bacterium]|nr:hypothetical protein [Bdellovibrionales bacterium]